MLENDGRVVSNFVVQALRGEPLTIYGSGRQTRSLCFVDDLVDGLVLLMGSADRITGPCNLGNPHELTVADIARLVIELTHSRSRISYQELPQDDPKRRRPTIDRASEWLGWHPTVSIEDGLRATIDYFALKIFTRDGRVRAETAGEPAVVRTRGKPLLEADRGATVTLASTQN
jgi:UDP-glucuronate decarboxylase